jgi:hypothetical protein
VGSLKDCNFISLLFLRPQKVGFQLFIFGINFSSKKVEKRFGGEKKRDVYLHPL